MGILSDAEGWSLRSCARALRRGDRSRGGSGQASTSCRALSACPGEQGRDLPVPNRQQQCQIQANEPSGVHSRDSPDMDVENAYYFNEKSQSKPGTPAQKGNCKVGQRSPQSQAQIRKKFPGARITFPKLVRCNVNSIHDFVTVYVHAKAAKHVKEIPVDDMIKASYSQNNELRESVEVPLVGPNHKNEDFSA